MCVLPFNEHASPTFVGVRDSNFMKLESFNACSLTIERLFFNNADSFKLQSLEFWE